MIKIGPFSCFVLYSFAIIAHAKLVKVSTAFQYFRENPFLLRSSRGSNVKKKYVFFYFAYNSSHSIYVKYQWQQ